MGTHFAPYCPTWLKMTRHDTKGPIMPIWPHVAPLPHVAHVAPHTHISHQCGDAIGPSTRNRRTLRPLQHQRNRLKPKSAGILWEHMFAPLGSRCPDVTPNGQYGPMWPHVAPYTHIYISIDINTHIYRQHIILWFQGVMSHRHNPTLQKSAMRPNQHWETFVK